MKWELNKQYKKGDIARVVSNFYICIKQHVSDNLMRPSKDDMYWMHLSKPIINNIKKNVMKTSGDSEFVNNKMVMDDDESDYDSEEDINAIKDAMMTGLENAFKKQGIPMLNLIIPTQQKETIQIPKKTNSKVNNELKRKLAEEENKIVSYKKSRTGLPDSEYKNRILLLDVDIKTKTYILDKYENIKKMGSSDYSKGMAWLNTVLNIPFGKCKDFINNNDTKLYMKQVKEVLDKHVHGLEDVKQEILEFVARKVTNPNGKGHVLALHGVKGTGKCHGLNTPILMYDGSVKMVQDVKVGDMLMGDDSTPRNVLSLARGREEMFNIEHTLHNESYIVNKSHILTLKMSDNKEIIDIPVEKYLNLDKSLKKQLQGFKVGVEFKEREVEFEPYIIGLWLGNNCQSVKLTTKYNLINNNNIPDMYMINSRENRLKLLAGLIDSKCFYIDNNMFKIQDYKFAEDIMYLCKSLGYHCCLKNDGEINNIVFYGNNLQNIPTKKYCLKSELYDPLVTAISVTSMGEGDYYGFELDGNHRYLLGSFIVTHNTKIARALAEALQLPFNQINFGGMNDAAILNGHSETYVGSKPGKLVDIMIDSGVMNGIIMMDEVDKISESKNKEINGILTHLLDEEQNKEFQDNYIGQVPIDLSKVLFVITFNDIDKVDHIVSDRMKIINITSPSIDDKLIIARDKMIPEICNKTICFDKKYKFIIEDNVIYDIIKNRTYGEIGVRKLKKALEEIFNKVNYYLIADESKLHINTISTDEIYVNITRSFVNNILQNNNQEDQSYMSMYI